MSLPNEQSGEQKSPLERRRNRLIARVPATHLAMPAAIELRQFLGEKSELPPNSPLFSITSSSEPYSEDVVLHGQGVEVDSQPNVEIRNLYRPLREWEEGKKEATMIDELLPNVSKLDALLSQPHTASPIVLSAASTYCRQNGIGAGSLREGVDRQNNCRLYPRSERKSPNGAGLSRSGRCQLVAPTLGSL
jgi:hypothetical protein